MSTATNTFDPKMQNGLKSYLRGLARRRKSGTVTADDAVRWLTNRGIKNVRTRMSYTNRILNANSDTFTSVGTVHSSRPEMRGSRITEWSFVG